MITVQPLHDPTRITSPILKLNLFKYYTKHNNRTTNSPQTNAYNNANKTNNNKRPSTIQHTDNNKDTAYTNTIPSLRPSSIAIRCFPPIQPIVIASLRAFHALMIRPRDQSARLPRTHDSSHLVTNCFHLPRSKSFIHSLHLQNTPTNTSIS